MTGLSTVGSRTEPISGVVRMSADTRGSDRQTVPSQTHASPLVVVSIVCKTGDNCVQPSLCF